MTHIFMEHVNSDMRLLISTNTEVEGSYQEEVATNLRSFIMYLQFFKLSSLSLYFISERQ